MQTFKRCWMRSWPSWECDTKIDWTKGDHWGCQTLVLALVLSISGCQSDNKSSPNPLVSSVVSSRQKLEAHPSDRAANMEANEALHLLINDRTAVGDEALAILAGHYLGESGEPECEILARGVRMVPLLKHFSEKDPILPLRRSTVDSREQLIELIGDGKICE